MINSTSSHQRWHKITAEKAMRQMGGIQHCRSVMTYTRWGDRTVPTKAYVKFKQFKVVGIGQLNKSYSVPNNSCSCMEANNEESLSCGDDNRMNELTRSMFGCSFWVTFTTVIWPNLAAAVLL